ncbi:MAG: nuclear transport factor 2 family protein [Flavitalea sp.]
MEKANAAVSAGDHEGFLQFCTEDCRWVFLNDKTLAGKSEIRAWMKTEYINPPKFQVERFISEEEFVVAMGEITITDAKGNSITSDYCDVWKFREGKMAELRAFVMEK